VRSAAVRLGATLGSAFAAAFFFAACADLFHSTADVRTACEIDAATAGCTAEAGAPIDEAGLDFCSWSSAQARTNAQRACAWLGACEGPLGGNAFGECTVQARLAFDCTANPAHPVQGIARDRWACLASARTCQDIHDCLVPKALQCSASGDYLACPIDGGTLRVECDGVDAAPRVEDCALWGQTCTSNGPSAACGPGEAPIDCLDAGGGCLGSQRTTVRWCEGDGGQIGVDCASNGEQACGVFPEDGGARWAACIPVRDAGAVCAATLAAQCTNGVAHLCPTGTPESVDCAALLDAPDACVARSLDPPYDWTSACSLGAPCPPDTCAGAMLNGCARGAAFSVDCSAVGLGPCTTFTTDNAAVTRAACTPP
jgi:hypothetical protein